MNGNIFTTLGIAKVEKGTVLFKGEKIAAAKVCFVVFPKAKTDERKEVSAYGFRYQKADRKDGVCTSSGFFWIEDDAKGSNYKLLKAEYDRQIKEGVLAEEREKKSAPKKSTKKSLADALAAEPKKSAPKKSAPKTTEPTMSRNDIIASIAAMLAQLAE